MRFFMPLRKLVSVQRLRKLVSVPRLMVLFVVVGLVAGTLTAVHISGPAGSSTNAGILPPGSQGTPFRGVPLRARI